MYQIFVVEDELLIRQSIRTMVENMGGPYVFCGEASDGEMALSLMQDLMPDILLTDIKMPFLNGLDLISHAKAIMPQLRVIIISGYDEFESAQKAITLGVDQYLLKPIRAPVLISAIEKTAEQIEKNKAIVTSEYERHELQDALHLELMNKLFFGGTDTSSILERAAKLHIDLVQPFYQVALFHFDSGIGSENGNTRQRIGELLEDEKSAIYYFDGADQLAILAYGKTKENLDEHIYRINSVIRYGLRDFDLVITTLIGNVVNRISSVKDAYCAADTMIKKILGTSAGKTIDINDTAQIATDIVSFSSTFGMAYQKRLQYATKEDVQEILKEFWDSADSDQFNSLLFRYYTLIDMLKTAVQIVSSSRPGISQKDIAAEFTSSYDIFVASNQRDTFEEMCERLLLEAVEMKGEGAGFLRQSHVITKAENYITDNFCDPNITLICVANHVGLSPAHFSTVFSQTVGKSFITYLTTLRVEKAKELLVQTDMKLAAIATEIGYNEPNYFSHVFKKHEGITPKEFRNNQKK